MKSGFIVLIVFSFVSVHSLWHENYYEYDVPWAIKQQPEAGKSGIVGVNTADLLYEKTYT